MLTVHGSGLCDGKTKFTEENLNKTSLQPFQAFFSSLELKLLAYIICLTLTTWLY